MKESNWSQHVGHRLLIRERFSRYSLCEWKLLEISPSGERGKFHNAEADSKFWLELENLAIVEVLQD